MSAYPDLAVTGVRENPSGISWDSPVQFTVGLEVRSEEGTTDALHFWLEYFSIEGTPEERVTEMISYGALARGAYNVQVPADPLPLPRHVFTTGGFLCVRAHYVLPAPQPAVDVLRMCYSIDADVGGETFALVPMPRFPVLKNPRDFVPPEPEESEEGDESDEIVLGGGESDEESVARSPDSPVREEEEEELSAKESSDEDEIVVGGIKRTRDDDDADDDDKPPKAPRFECANCLRTHAALLRCSQCRTAYYCDVDCQAAHFAVHRVSCGSMYMH